MTNTISYTIMGVIINPCHNLNKGSPDVFSAAVTPSNAGNKQWFVS